jgi:uncharacterized DUF497 family protein
MIEKADMFAVISFRTGPGRSEFWAVWGEDTVSDPENGWFDPSYYNNTVWGDYRTGRRIKVISARDMTPSERRYYGRK